MNIPLSRRLAVCASFIKQDDRVADIGCDHGYLGIYLLTQGIAECVYAADIKEGPLQSAKNNAVKYGCTNRISFFLSNGVCSIPRDFTVMVCAGMGGDVMVSILESASWLKSIQYRLVLQCQSRTHILRKYLNENGWTISKERAVKDGRFIYTVMEVIYQKSPVMTPGRWYYSSALEADESDEATNYGLWVIRQLRVAVESQGVHVNSDIEQAFEELNCISRLKGSNV